MEAISESAERKPIVGELTAREKQCLEWLSRGLRSDEIAYQLDLKKVTVDMHLGNAKHKLNARTREQLLVLAMRNGLIE